jgi:hypothetical protein
MKRHAFLLLLMGLVGGCLPFDSSSKMFRMSGKADVKIEADLDQHLPSVKASAVMDVTSAAEAARALEAELVRERNAANKPKEKETAKK